MASFRRDVLSHLAAGHYEILDERAQVAQDEKQRFANGLWKLHQFYGAFPLTGNDLDAAWEARLAEIRAWQQARPESAPAAIALAEVHSAYAWKARADGGAAASATEPLFRKRLETALAVLEDARGIAANDPHYWHTAHGVAAGLGWATADLNDLHKKAAALAPHYWSNDIVHISAVLARNGADPEAVEAMAATAFAAEDEYASAIYACAAWAVSEAAGGDFLAEVPFDWSRVQAGYLALLSRHPGSTELLSQYCVMACHARDKAAARKCFVKLGGKADLGVFKTPRDYERHLRWASWN